RRGRRGAGDAGPVRGARDLRPIAAICHALEQEIPLAPRRAEGLAALGRAASTAVRIAEPAGLAALAPHPAGVRALLEIHVVAASGPRRAAACDAASGRVAERPLRTDFLWNPLRPVDAAALALLVATAARLGNARCGLAATRLGVAQDLGRAGRDAPNGAVGRALLEHVETELRPAAHLARLVTPRGRARGAVRVAARGGVTGSDGLERAGVRAAPELSAVAFVRARCARVAARRRSAASARLGANGDFVPARAVGVAAEEARSVAPVLAGLANGRLAARRGAACPCAGLTKRRARADLGDFPAVEVGATTEQVGAVAAERARFAHGQRTHGAARPACLLAERARLAVPARLPGAALGAHLEDAAPAVHLARHARAARVGVQVALVRALADSDEAVSRAISTAPLEALAIAAVLAGDADDLPRRLDHRLDLVFAEQVLAAERRAREEHDARKGRAKGHQGSTGGSTEIGTHWPSEVLHSSSAPGQSPSSSHWAQAAPMHPFSQFWGSSSPSVQTKSWF